VFNLIFTATTTTTYITFLGNGNADGQTQFCDNISVKEIPGNHATQATAASRPVLKQDTNGKYYLFFDGVDDSLSTGSIDFTSTDKMTVFAGVRKLSDAASGCCFESSVDTATNNGSFGCFAPASAGTNKYQFGSRGSTYAVAFTTNTLYNAPNISVVAGIGNISGDSSILRVNGTQAATSTADQGTGNYGNYPLFVGRRGGTSLPFNGHLYSLIIRGAQSTDAQIVSAETYVNSKTGAY
jgi:hypothetical protein